MTEILFILTTLYVAYVFYSSANDSKPQAPRPAVQPKPIDPAPEATSADEPVAQASEQMASEEIETELTESEEAAHEESEQEDAVAGKVSHIRNPLTGEISKVNISYLFTKRWIKEALVSEGLLDKIYVSHDLNPTLNAQIRKALATLKTLPKYHV